jgi:DNA-binding transcriptional LysR family regulator
MLVMRAMELRDLLTFVAVAETGSLRLAAERLHVSQPAVTRRIQNLERTAGRALLDHRSRPITLTVEGREFLERSQRALTMLGELKGSTSPERETDLECRLGMPASLADLVLPGLAVTMAEEFPRLRVHFSIAWSDVLFRELQAGTVDAALVYAVEDLPPTVMGERVAQLPVSIIDSRRRPRARGPMRMTQLNTQRWVMNPEGCCFRSILNGMLDPRRTSSMQMILEVVGFKRQLSVGAGAGIRARARPPAQSAELAAAGRALRRSRGADPRLDGLAVRRDRRGGDRLGDSGRSPPPAALRAGRDGQENRRSLARVPIVGGRSPPLKVSRSIAATVAITVRREWQTR